MSIVKRWRNLLLIIGGVLLAPGAVSAAATFYIDYTGGNDGNSGTSTASAWKTLDHVMDGSVHDGDTVCLRRGELWRQTLTVPADNLTIRDYGTGALPVISGGTSITGWSGGPALWHTWFTRGADWVLIDGVAGNTTSALNQVSRSGDWYFDSTGDTLYLNYPQDPNLHQVEFNDRNYCLHANGMDDLLIENLSFTLAWDSAVYLAGNRNTVQHCVADASDFGVHAPAGYQGQRIVENQLQRNYHGITIRGSANWVAGNTVTGLTIGIQLEGGQAFGNTVSGNACHDLTDPAYGSGLYIAGASGNRIASNLCYNSVSGIGIMGGNDNVFLGNTVHDVAYGLWLDATGSDPVLNNQIIGNRVYHCTACALETDADDNTNSNNAFYNNLAYDNTCAGFQTWGRPSRVLFENNTLDRNTYGITFSMDGQGFFVRNNIFSNSASADLVFASGPALTWHENNCYYRAGPDMAGVYAGGNTLATQAQMPSYDPTVVTGDPHFVDAAGGDFHLRWNSSCIDHGTLAEIYGRDFDNNAPLGLPDIGAYEYMLLPHMTSLAWENIPGQSLSLNTQGNLVGQIACSAYQYDTLRTMTVANLGTARSGEDITALGLWYSALGTTATAVSLGTFTAADSKTWTLNGLSAQIAHGGKFFLLADIAPGARVGRTCDFSLPAGLAVFANSGPMEVSTLANTDYLVINSVLVVYAELTADLAKPGAPNLVRGQSGAPLASLVFNNTSDHAVTLHTLSLCLQAPDGAALDPGKLFAGLRLLQNGQTVASLASPFAAGLSFDFGAGLTIASQASVTLAVEGTVAENPAADAFRLGLLNSRCVNQGLMPVDAVAGKNFPLLTGNLHVRGTDLASSFRNYPNPFQTTAHINYYLKESAQVRLEVWSQDRRLVRQILSEDQSPGLQSAEWDGRNQEGLQVLSGVYLLKLEVGYVSGGQEQQVKKIVLAR